MNRFIKKERTQEHANGKSVVILRDYSVQAKIVNSELKRKRRNDVRNAKTANDLLIDSTNSDVAEPALSAEGESEGDSVRDKAADRLKRSVPSERVRQQADSSPVKTEGNGGCKESAIFSVPGLRMVREDGGTGLCEPDGVGRGEEPALHGDGGDSSLSDQPV
jgi:hypothetical protein